MPNNEFTIDTMRTGDWPKVRAIFAEGLADGFAAFMTSPPIWPDFDAGRLPFGRLVARRGSGLLGWTALTRVADT